MRIDHQASPKPRFWTIPIPNRDNEGNADLSDWFGVVDEEREGIIAYFGLEAEADAYITFRGTKKGQ